MGYTTNFSGEFEFDKPLTVEQMNIINEFADTDHRNDKGMPGYWCQWVCNKDATGLMWDENEKFYDYEEWLVWLIYAFFEPWGITLNGSVNYQGEEIGDVGVLKIISNEVAKNEVSLDGTVCPHCGETITGEE